MKLHMFASLLFRSRWFALIWAAGILWFALQIVGRNETPPSTNSSFRIDAR
jgi:hypothetical protein